MSRKHTNTGTIQFEMGSATVSVALVGVPPTSQQHKTTHRLVQCRECRKPSAGRRWQRPRRSRSLLQLNRSGSGWQRFASPPHSKMAFLAAILVTAITTFTLGAAEPPSLPLTPAEERASFRLADEQLRIELVAAEPHVVSPVAMAWDAQGRLFLAEMIDYPAGPTAGRIKLLEDRDGDGRYEQATVFAEGLSFPNGVLPWNEGVLVTAAPDILFLKDTDGDGRADERRVQFTGFGQGNQQLRVNGLFWGLDNWVYGANGRSDGEIRRSEDSTGKTVSIRKRDFRFRPDTGQFEAIAGQSQFGSAQNDWGHRFLSWNTIPIRHEVLPERYLNRNPHLAVTESVAELLEPNDTQQVFPLTPPPLTFNNESTSHFNALAGLTIFRGQGLGESYHGNAFVGESLRNLVHRRVLVPNGATFTARRGEEGTEFLASTDPWFHPVNFATGPDGALYVVDFYRRFVEHPDFVPEKLRGQVPWQAGAEHGRVWRIQSSKLKIKNALPNLSRATTKELAKCLEHPNGWWRDTAQRLLVERRDRAIAPLLEKIVRSSSKPEARLHALYTLDGLDALTPEILTHALKDLHPAVREHALRLSEPFLAGTGRAGRASVPSSPDLTGAASQRISRSRLDGVSPSQSNELRRAFFALVNDPEARVRFQLALSLGELEANARLDALTQLAQRDCASHWHARALLSSVGPKPWPFLKRLLQEQNWLNAAQEPPHRTHPLPLPGGEQRTEHRRPLPSAGGAGGTAVELGSQRRVGRSVPLSQRSPNAWVAAARQGRLALPANPNSMAVGAGGGFMVPMHDPKAVEALQEGQFQFLDQVARLVGAACNEEELADCLTLLLGSATAGQASQWAVLAGLSNGLAQSKRPLHDLLRNPPAWLREHAQTLNGLLQSATNVAGSLAEKTGQRLFAIRLLGQARRPFAGPVLLQQLNPTQPAEIQVAAAGAVVALEDRAAAEELFAGWSEYATTTRRQVLAAATRSPLSMAALVVELEQGSILPIEIDAVSRQALLRMQDAALKQRVEKILATLSSSDREEAVRRFEPALKMDADRKHGAELFVSTCLICHAVQGQGQHLGPDLSGLASRPKEALLADIIDPSRQVSPDFIGYSIVTKQGETLAGLIAAETGASIMLRRAGQPEETVLRSQIKELRAEGKSLMPDGLEQGLSQQDMADLLAFLCQPDAALLPKEK